MASLTRRGLPLIVGGSPTIEELEQKQAELRTQIKTIDDEYTGQTLPEGVRDEWNRLNTEHDELDGLLDELRARVERIREFAGNKENRADGGAHFHTRTERARGDDIWDLSTIRTSVTDTDGARRELHDRARRALETASFGDDRIRREDAQEHVDRLLAHDTQDAEIARLILQTGSPTYRSAFRKYFTNNHLNPEEQRAFSLGTTGIPIPYTLDPTVIPVSNSVVNPLRAISSVEQIVGSNEWRGVTAAAISASRDSEATEVSDDTPTLAQPTIVCSKVQAFVPFSIESAQDWTALEANMGRLFADAKDDEEATSFATGNGTPPNPFGVLTGTTNTVAASSGLTLTYANLLSLEAALPPRFRPRAQIVANRGIYAVARTIDTGGGAALWIRMGEGLANNPASIGGVGNTGARLLDYPAHELSTMQATIVNATKIVLMGDFNYFKIIDRVGMQVEMIPHLFATGNNRPDGTRGLYAYWRNGSKVIDAAAFRALTGTT